MQLISLTAKQSPMTLTILFLWFITTVTLIAYFSAQVLAPSITDKFRMLVYGTCFALLIICVMMSGVSFVNAQTTYMVNALLLGAPWLFLVLKGYRQLEENSTSAVYEKTYGSFVRALKPGFNIVLWGNYEVKVAPHSDADTVMSVGKETFNDLVTPDMQTKKRGINARWTYSGGLKLKIVDGSTESSLREMQDYTGGPDAARARAFSLMNTVFKNMTRELDPLEIDQLANSEEFNADFASNLHHLYELEDIPFELDGFNVEDTWLPDEVYVVLREKYKEELQQDGLDVKALRIKERAHAMGLDITKKEEVEMYKILIGGDINLSKVVSEHRLNLSPELIELAETILRNRRIIA